MRTSDYIFIMIIHTLHTSVAVTNTVCYFITSFIISTRRKTDIPSWSNYPYQYSLCILYADSKQVVTLPSVSCPRFNSDVTIDVSKTTSRATTVHINLFLLLYLHKFVYFCSVVMHCTCIAMVMPLQRNDVEFPFCIGTKYTRSQK